MEATIEEIHKILALEILTEMLKGKDLPSIINKTNIVNLIEKVKTSSYLYIHTPLSEDPNQIEHFSVMIKQFIQDLQLFYEHATKTIPESISFDIELYKYGKNFSSSLRKRFAILTSEGFFSSKNPIKSFIKEKSKNKTPLILGGKIFKQTLTDNNKKMEWANLNKPFRIKLEFLDKEKVKHFFLYFENEDSMNQAAEFLSKFTINIKATNQDLAIMENSISKSYIMYAMIKLLNVKNQIKRKKNCLKFLEEKISEDFDSFSLFAQSFQKSLKSLHEKQKHFKAYPKYKFIISKIPNVVNFKTENTYQIQKSINIIKSQFILKKQIECQKQKAVAFNLVPNSVKYFDFGTDNQPILDSTQIEKIHSTSN